MSRDIDELRECCSRLGAAGYEIRRVDEFDGAAIAVDYGDRGEPFDVGIVMTHDALDNIRRDERIKVHRELAAGLCADVMLYAQQNMRHPFGHIGLTARHQMADELTKRADALAAQEKP